VVVPVKGMTRCPEALYGHHGVPNSLGRCPYCGEQLTVKGWKYSRTGRGRRSISPQEEQWLDSRERERDAWGVLRVPPEQDPDIDPDPDDSIYD
jgi:hypothetical protein